LNHATPWSSHAIQDAHAQVLLSSSGKCQEAMAELLVLLISSERQLVQGVGKNIPHS